MDTKRLAQKPLPEHACFLVIVIGMAKDFGFSRKQLLEEIKVAWPHVKYRCQACRKNEIPEGAEYCDDCYA